MMLKQGYILGGCYERQTQGKQCIIWSVLQGIKNLRDILKVRK
jgi:hypothetical protein